MNGPELMALSMVQSWRFFLFFQYRRLWVRDVKLQVSLYRVQQVCRELEHVLSAVILSIDHDIWRMISETGHLEGWKDWGWISAAWKALIVDFDNAVFLYLSNGVAFFQRRFVFLKAHQGDVLFVNFLLDLKVVDERTEVVKLSFDLLSSIEPLLDLAFPVLHILKFVLEGFHL